MARQTTFHLVDDIDGSVIDTDSGETIEFAVSGVRYVIDLKTKNAKEFHRKLGYYIDHATRVGGRRRRSSAVTPSRRDPRQTRTIRQWAADKGYVISDRGRIPAEIVRAFEASH